MLGMDEFTVGFRVQKSWGAAIALESFLTGSGAGLFSVSAAVGFVTGIGLGILIALGGVLVLLMHLRRPRGFWRALWRPASSWLSRGTIFIILFIGFGVLYLLPDVAGWEAWSGSTTIGLGLLIGASVFAVLTMVYSGFTLSTPAAIAYWHTPLLPIIFVLESLLSGTALAFLSLGSMGVAGASEVLLLLQLVLLASSLLCLVTYISVMASSTPGARESVILLIKSPSLGLFTGGAILLGLLIPLAIQGYVFWAGISLPLVVLALIAVFILVGSLLFRYIVLRVGVYAPVRQESQWPLHAWK